MADRFNFMTPGENSPAWAHYLSISGVVLSIVGVFVGVNLWLFNIIIALVTGLVVGILLYGLVQVMEARKVDGETSLVGFAAGFVVLILFVGVVVNHGLFNAVSSEAYMSSKVGEYVHIRNTYATALRELSQFELCEHGFLDLTSIETQLQAKVIEFGDKVQRASLPVVQFFSNLTPLGDDAIVHYDAVTDIFEPSNLGSCASPLDAIKPYTIPDLPQGTSPLGSVGIVQLPIVIFVMLVIGGLLLLPVFMSAAGARRLEKNRYKGGNR